MSCTIEFAKTTLVWLKRLRKPRFIATTNYWSFFNTYSTMALILHHPPEDVNKQFAAHKELQLPKARENPESEWPCTTIYSKMMAKSTANYHLGKILSKPTYTVLFPPLISKKKGTVCFHHKLYTDHQSIHFPGYLLSQ